MAMTTTQPGGQTEQAGFRFDAREEFWLVGLGGAGPYTKARQWVMPLWRELIRRQDELPPSIDRSLYISPCHGRETEFTFYIGFAAKEPIAELPEGMLCIRIPAHEYAVGEVRGAREQIDTVYAALPAWAASQGRPTNPAILWLEIYREAPGEEPAGPFDFDVYLPLR